MMKTICFLKLLVRKMNNLNGIKSPSNYLLNLMVSFSETANNVDRDGSIIWINLLNIKNGHRRKILL